MLNEWQGILYSGLDATNIGYQPGDLSNQVRFFNVSNLVLSHPTPSSLPSMLQSDEYLLLHSYIDHWDGHAYIALRRDLLPLYNC